MSLDTNKHQTDINNNKTAPKPSSTMPPPRTITTTSQPPPLLELESDELPTNLNENVTNSNETKITPCNTQKSKNEIPPIKLAFII